MTLPVSTALRSAPLTRYAAVQTYKLLEASLERVLATYEVVDEAIERTETPFEDDEAGSAQLRELWTLLKPEQELSGLVSKQWQELGFQ